MGAAVERESGPEVGGPPAEHTGQAEQAGQAGQAEPAGQAEHVALAEWRARLGALSEAKFSGTLSMRDPYAEGHLWLRSGRIVEASYGRLSGYAALHALMRRSPAASISQPSDTAEIGAPFEEPLAALIEDARARVVLADLLRSRLPGPEVQLTIDLAHPHLARLGIDVSGLVELFVAGASVDEALAASPLGEVETMQLLLIMVRAGALVAPPKPGERTVSPRSPRPPRLGLPDPEVASPRGRSRTLALLITGSLVAVLGVGLWTQSDASEGSRGAVAPPPTDAAFTQPERGGVAPSAPVSEPSVPAPSMSAPEAEVPLATGEATPSGSPGESAETPEDAERGEADTEAAPGVAPRSPDGERSAESGEETPEEAPAAGPAQGAARSPAELLDPASEGADPASEGADPASEGADPASEGADPASEGAPLSASLGVTPAPTPTD